MITQKNPSIDIKYKERIFAGYQLHSGKIDAGIYNLFHAELSDHILQKTKITIHQSTNK